MNTNANVSSVPGNVDGVILDSESVQAIRFRMHELANVFTGVMIAAGLLSQHLEGGSLAQYAADICEGSERGSLLVREIRGQLLAASGEVQLSPGGSGTVQAQGQ